MAVEPNAHKHLNRQHRIIFATILASLCANLLYPGEVFFQSKYLLIFTSVFACFIVLAEQLKAGSVTVSARVLARPFLPILILLPSVFMTVNGSRSQEVFWLFFSYACLFFTVRALEIDDSSVVCSVLALSFVTLLIELYSFYQYFSGLSNLRSLVLQSTELDESFRSGLLARIGSRRVYANFPLPNTLAGFLTMTLPLQFFLLYRSVWLRKSHSREQDRFLNNLLAQPWVTCAFVVQFSLSFICLALTQSFGGWVCFLGSFIVIAGSLFSYKRITVTRVTMLILVVFFFAGVWMVWLNHRRGFGLWNVRAAENPIALRWISFTTAMQIFSDFPLTGVGLGNYGIVNPMYQTAYKNVTQYAHNTFLQLLSEAGLLCIALVLVGSWTMGKAMWYLFKGNGRHDNRPISLPLCVSASLVAWLVHNLLDIDLYFPSVGSLGIFLLALLTKSPAANDTNSPQKLANGLGGPHGARSADRHDMGEFLIRRKTQAKLLSTVLLMTLSAIILLVARDYFAQVMFSLALQHMNNKDLQKATQYADIALSASPTNPNIIILQGKLEALNASANGKKGLEALIRLKQAYERGTRLDPFNASYHYELSRILDALGEKRLALEARVRAINLFPSEVRFRVPTSLQTD